MTTKVKTVEEIDNIKVSGQMLATVLNVMKLNTGIGAIPKELASMAAKELKALGGQPAFLGYQGFPDVICISLNEEVVHGIPGNIPVKEGDLISFDFGVSYNGMITDSAITLAIGEVPADFQRLVSATQESLTSGIKAVKSGAKTGDIGAAVEKILNRNKLGIVRDLVGHGVGHNVHEEPNIPNYGEAGTGFTLEAGMTIAIEPMATLGGDDVYVTDDGWTVTTSDKSLSAHFEHTVLVTDSGSQILTSLS